MVDPGNPGLSVRRQCELVGLPRSSYYAPRQDKPEFTEEEERAMAIIDGAHADNPYYGARSHMSNLAKRGIRMGRHHVARLMAAMGIRSTAPQPKTSENKREHPRFPTSCAALPYAGRTRCGPPTSPTCPLGAGTSTCRR